MFEKIELFTQCKIRKPVMTDEDKIGLSVLKQRKNIYYCTGKYTYIEQNYIKIHL